MVHFVGAGPGAVDLITIRGQKYIEEADVIIYAGSLVNPELLSKARPDCQVYDSSRLSLEEVIDLMKDTEKSGEKIVRLHTGDPSIYGAIREQMDELDKLGISYDYTPGVSSFCGAAAALNLEYTLPGISQSVLLTRMPGRTPAYPSFRAADASAASGRGAPPGRSSAGPGPWGSPPGSPTGIRWSAVPPSRRPTRPM